MRTLSATWVGIGPRLKRAPPPSALSPLSLPLPLTPDFPLRPTGSEITEEKLNVFLEYVSGGSVASCLVNFGMFAEELTRLLTYQILHGLEYLHAR